MPARATHETGSRVDASISKRRGVGGTHRKLWLSPCRCDVSYLHSFVVPACWTLAHRSSP